jgi:hypothetical protein
LDMLELWVGLGGKISRGDHCSFIDA